MSTTTEKGKALLSFLKASATIRRKRINSYGPGDKALWFADVPRDRSECRSPVLAANPNEFGDVWFETRKKPMPSRPALPTVLIDWIRADDLEYPNKQPEPRPEITVLVKHRIPDPEAAPESGKTVLDERPETRRLNEHPEVEEAWLDYLVNKWEPWAQEMQRWQEVQRVYEALDFMRRRLEESEERYEFIFAVGLLQWRDPTGASIKRHLLTAPAEINLDAARGILTVVPAASFDSFRIELDMLELQHQPRLEGPVIESQLGELDIQAWDTTRIGQILRDIANRLSSNSQVAETEFRSAERADEIPRIFYAPALVLRERRPTAYEDIVRQFLQIVEDAESEDTKPWCRLLLEGESQENPSPAPSSLSTDSGHDATPVVSYLFPMPANDEQRQILHRLQTNPCVLVKGPPGTGKSHTIANLICHLLASGDRVLVTAHAPKALAVLRGLLPDDVRDLTVTTFGSSREDQRLLEESVRGILRRKSDWRGEDWAIQAANQIEARLREVEGELATVERRLRECREAETHSHALPGGYQGTAAQIARRVAEEQERFSWFPEGGSADSTFPLQVEELSFLVEVHKQVSRENAEEFRMDVGDFQLPEPDQFSKFVARLRAAEESAARAKEAASLEKLEALSTHSGEAIASFQTTLQSLDEHATRAVRILGDLGELTIADLLVGHVDKWNHLSTEANTIANTANALLADLGTARVEVPVDVHRDRLRVDVERRRNHFEQGGRRGFSVFAARVVKETRYVENGCLVDGHSAADLTRLRSLHTFLQLEESIRAFRQAWPSPLPEISDAKRAVTHVVELSNAFRELLMFLKTLNPTSIACLPSSARAGLAGQTDRRLWIKAVKAEIERRAVRSATESLERLLEVIRRYLGTKTAHPCLQSLAQAAQTRDVDTWRASWNVRERFRKDKNRFRRYQELLEKLSASYPSLGEVVRDTTGDQQWTGKILDIDKAWAWSSARAWLRHISESSVYKGLVNDFHRLQRRAEKATEELVSIRAWNAFFQRLDGPTIQSLNAWTRAVERIGKGTGKHAYRHRRTARTYLTECVPKIPAWVMPLHKLWDTVEAKPGMFDTVIVDEASQAGIESLILLLMAKRIIVVGDDKQNSPEAVGVLEDDIARLAREHLRQFRFRDEYRPDTSLFDHAERTFGVPISLREHFRCVPEIIRFSNELCYRDAPLIPLRQAPPQRVPPLQSRFVPEGACEGEGQRIRNRAEAEAVVNAIQSVLANDSYEGKSMGVIALQGHSQAELIEHLLLQQLDPKTIEERKIRCGEPATFQGDQRDIIFLSLVIAPNVHYRALNRLPDQRRFNVAMSRARDQVWLFHSVRQQDLGPDDLRRKLVSFFDGPGFAVLARLSEDCERLEREARGPRRLGNQPEPYESWFEVDVALELLRRKYSIRPQVEVAGKRIDLVIEGLEARLAVECDGDEWHGAESYDHDMARQRQLERAGWVFVRVRESDFYVNREAAVATVTDACEELGIYSVDQREHLGKNTLASAPSARYDTESSEAESTNELHNQELFKVVPTESQTPLPLNERFPRSMEASGFPDPRDASPANVRDVVRQIVESEGPLSKASIYRLYVQGCPAVDRAGRVVRNILNRVLWALQKTGEVIVEDELGDRSPEGQIVRSAGAPKVRERPAGNRDLTEIPPSELLAVVERLSPSNTEGTHSDEAEFRHILGHYGFSRLTRPRREYLSKVLRRGKSSGSFH